jgi:predicted DNA-binding ribbon-helix-helix protein
MQANRRGPSPHRKRYNPTQRPRTIVLGNRRTSLRLEPVMWAALADIANQRSKTVHDVIAEISRAHDQASLSSAIRVYIVHHYRAALKGVR